jgi:hypothetical protein
MVSKAIMITVNPIQNSFKSSYIMEQGVVVFLILHLHAIVMQ